MPQRDFDTATWGDPFFQPLSPEAKLLFIYLWTNPNTNQAGMYEITLDTIAAGVRLPAEDIPGLMKSLEGHVEWSPDTNIIWVKNFLRRQCKSPKFFIAAMNCLKNINNNGMVKDFLNYNRNLLIQYQYNIDTLSI